MQLMDGLNIIYMYQQILKDKMEEFFKLDTSQKIEHVKYKYECERCGRNNFDRPGPHRCNNQFRKRGLTWTQRIAEENGN